MTDTLTAPIPDRILYYPYMRVPNNEWFTRVLLYWDSVGTILPGRYAREPSRVEPYTAELIDADLVKPVVPADHTGNITDFSETFLRWLDTSVAVESRTARRRAVSITFSIHLEKMGMKLAEELRRRGLAQRSDGSQYRVEMSTAREFMAYLAAVLGQLEGYVPGTDQRQFLEVLAAVPKAKATTLAELETREILLEGVLPAPQGGVSAVALSRFKNRHADQLVRFRRRLEKEVIDLAQIADDDTRLRRAVLVQQELVDERRDIEQRMRGSRLGAIQDGSLMAAAAGMIAHAAVTTDIISAGASLLALAAASVGRLDSSARGRRYQSAPLTYAALAQRKLAP